MLRFGIFLTKARNSRRLTIGELAKDAGVSTDTIVRGSSEDRCIWKGSTARKVLAALEAVAPLSAEEREAAVHFGILAAPRDAAQDETSGAQPASEDDELVQRLVARVGPRSAASAQRLFNAILGLIEAASDHDPSGESPTGHGQSTANPTGQGQRAQVQRGVDLPPPPKGAVKMRHPTGSTTYTPIASKPTADASKRKRA